MNTLYFALNNAKTAHAVTRTALLSLPAGWSCPGAKACLCKADRNTGKMQDGPNQDYRCSAAGEEARYPVARDSRWRNLELLKGAGSVSDMAKLIMYSLPDRAELVRPHASGDFFSLAYFDAWLQVSRQLPNVIFYAYTKQIPFWLQRRKQIPGNFRLTASFGGKWDALIEPNGLKYCKVVRSRYAAKKLGLPVDTDDSHAWNYDGNFALLLHGTQPPGVLAKAWRRLRNQGEGYGR